MKKYRDLIGLGGLALVVAGVWGRWGWPWALIVLGLPIATLYLLGELRGAE